MKGNIVVGQSGGPTSVINASVAGVYAAAKKLGVKKVYGMVHGIQGFLQEQLCDLDEQLGDEMSIELLKRTPSAFLGSCRFKMPQPDEQKEIYEKVFEILEKYHIEYFFYAGGNDSMDTVKMLSDYASEHHKSQRFIGIPKTIDNDLPVTDHCPGYGSAAKYIATSVKEVIRDNESFGIEKPTVCVIETMGRNAGWLTAAATLAKGPDCSGVDAVYLPEKVFDIDQFVEDVTSLADRKNSVVVAISEGIRIADGRYVGELGKDAAVDAFGHKQTAGSAVFLTNKIAAATGLKTRAVEISTLQRAASHLASLTDVNEAFQAGMDAVKAAEDGKTGMMIILERMGDDPYLCKTSLYDIHAIANVEKKIPDSWMLDHGKMLGLEFETYARPLIMGECMPVFINGIPRHLVLK